MAEKNPRIKRHYSVVLHAPNLVELRFGVWNPLSFTITDDKKGSQLARIVEALDGSRSAAEVARHCDVPRSDVEALVDHLDQLGALQTQPGSALDHYLENLVSTLTPLAKPVERPVVLLGDPTLTAAIEQQLRASVGGRSIVIPPDDDPRLRLLATETGWLSNGVGFHEAMAAFDDWSGSFLVVAGTVPNPAWLRALGRVSVARQIPWLHVCLDGPFLFVGPLFVPPSTACFECFETRVLMNIREHDSYVRYKKALVEGQVRGQPLPIEPALAGLAASHASLEALNFLHTGTGFTVGKVLSAYFPTMELSFNEVLRLPGCPACGALRARDERELYFDLRKLVDAPAPVSDGSVS